MGEGIVGEGVELAREPGAPQAAPEPGIDPDWERKAAEIGGGGDDDERAGERVH